MLTHSTSMGGTSWDALELPVARSSSGSQMVSYRRSASWHTCSSYSPCSSMASTLSTARSTESNSLTTSSRWSLWSALRSERACGTAGRRRGALAAARAQARLAPASIGPRLISASPAARPRGRCAHAPTRRPAKLIRNRSVERCRPPHLCLRLLDKRLIWWWGGGVLHRGGGRQRAERGCRR